ncbi:hypothetical protein Pfo_028623 [Paulownia fortunei]|nr:hypothetical protein Pfo_028623 [Paulownia fortunei]
MASMAVYFFAITPKSHSLSLSPKPLKSSQFNYFTPLPSLILSQPKKFRFGKTSQHSVDVTTTSAIRPGGSVESDKLPSDRRRVTIGDVASKAGLKLNEAQKALQALAADTSGFLEVSDEGDVLYVFPKDYRSKLAAKSFGMKIEPYWKRGSSSKTHKHEEGIREGDGGMNFIESVFSFVFGDGDPNQGIEEERWKLIGQYIASNGGVVTAEELAPYLDLETTEKMDDDSYILPVLLRFDGQPEVDEEGNILYRFPSLQRTAAPQRSGRKEYVGRRWADWVGEVEKFFKEKKWQFRAMVIGLGGLNLFGVIILGTMLKNMTVSPSGFISFVSDIFPLLQIYAGSFFAIPLVRWNQAREQRARALESPDLSLRRKLLSARDMAQRTVIGKDRIVYSTERDLYEQDYETREWDRRFKEIEKSD